MDRARPSISEIANIDNVQMDEEKKGWKENRRNEKSENYGVIGFEYRLVDEFYIFQKREKNFLFNSAKFNETTIIQREKNDSLLLSIVQTFNVVFPLN